MREAVWGNGPVDKTGTAPRIDFTTHKAAWSLGAGCALAWRQINTVHMRGIDRVDPYPGLVLRFEPATAEPLCCWTFGADGWTLTQGARWGLLVVTPGQ
ncbi:hypothetical protein GCM10010278_72920 [Streptomyces melanogenes]|nr:hypothetical protein GCM10010278_72920 [Streptomyces melanogenes]